MSKLGKILFYIALAGGVAAAVGGYLVLQKRAEDKANLVQMTAAKDTSDKAAAKAKQEALAAQQDKADAETKLTDATAKADDLNTQLTVAKKQATDAQAAVDTATAAAKAASAGFVQAGQSCVSTQRIFVLQCGDPTGTGSGGPGYKFADENLSGAKYTTGTVAMANAGPGTNGSQFFLVYSSSLSLPASYTPFGTIVSGLNIIQKVAKAGSDKSNGPGDGHPKEKVEIESVTIKKS